MVLYADTSNSANTAEGDSNLQQLDIVAAASSQRNHPRGRLGLHLEELANETLIRIFQYVDTSFYDNTSHRYHTAAQSVLNLGVCSSRFHHLLEQILYSNVVIKDDFHSRKLSGLPTFLSRILARPELARRVRSFQATARGSENTDESLDVSDLPDPDRVWIRAAVQAASESNEEAEDWIKGIEGGTWDSITALILSLAPNIAEFEFQNWDYTNLYPFLTRFFERATRLQETASLASPFSLRSLHRLSIIYLDTEGAFPIDSIIPFLRLRSLTVFHAHMVSEPSFRDDDTPPAWLASRPTFTTKDLEVSFKVRGNDFMTSFLRCFPALERLHYEYGGVHVSYSDSRPPRIMAALEQLKPHLKEITFLGEEMRYGSCDLQSCPLGSFSSFEKLTSIDAFATLLIGSGCPGTFEGFQRCQNLADVVPPSLESLTLRECGDVTAQYMMSQVSRLVLQRASIAPALKRIDLEWEGIQYPDKPRTPGTVIHPGFTEEEAAELLEECERAGIKLKVKYLPRQPKWVSCNVL